MDNKQQFMSYLQELMVDHYEVSLKTQMDIYKTAIHVTCFQAHAEAVNFLKVGHTINELEDFLINQIKEYDRVVLNAEGDIDFMLTAIFKKKAEAFKMILDFLNHYWEGIEEEE